MCVLLPFAFLSSFKVSNTISISLLHHRMPDLCGMHYLHCEILPWVILKYSAFLTFKGAVIVYSLLIEGNLASLPSILNSSAQKNASKSLIT